MDAQASSANVEASRRPESKVAAAMRARSIDYGPIIDGMVGRLAQTTADKRRNIYAQVRSVVIRGLAAIRLPQAALELEKLALDLAIARVEQRWRAKEAHKKSKRPHKKSAAAKSAAEKAIPPNIPGRQNEPSAAATAPVAARSLRSLAWPLAAAVALPITATAIFYLSRIDGKFTYGGEVGDRVGRLLSDARGGLGAGASIAAGDASAHRGLSQVNPIQAPVPAAPEGRAAAVPLPAGGGVDGRSAACANGPPASARDSCADNSTAHIATAPIRKTETGPPSAQGYSPFSDMIRGFGPANALRGPTVAPEDFAVDRLMPYPALAPGAASASAPPPPAASPRAAAPQEPQSPPARPINPKAAALVESGKQAALKDDLDRAVRDFSEAIRIDPKYPDSYLERGKIYFKQGETDRAIADYSAALAHDPQHAAALRARAMAHLYSGKNDLALADLSKAIELAEHDPRLLAPLELFYARRSRAGIYESREDYHLEIADCTALIESSAHDPTLAEALAAYYGSAGTANILAKLYRQRASALVKTSRPAQAVADLTAAIRFSSDRGYAALLDRAKLHELLGRRDLAVADARAALKIRPGSEEAQAALSRLSALSNPARPDGL
jgi:tetratricopeptide (TPR) repeat protein